MTARVLPFPKQLGPCPQCGWRHSDPAIRFLRWCERCNRAPFYPWTCPTCGVQHSVTVEALFDWTATPRHFPSPTLKFDWVYACPACAEDLNPPMRRRFGTRPDRPQC